jgi:hypothetical protein
MRGCGELGERRRERMCVGDADNADRACRKLREGK